MALSSSPFFVPLKNKTKQKKGFQFFYWSEQTLPPSNLKNEREERTFYIRSSSPLAFNNHLSPSWRRDWGDNSTPEPLTAPLSESSYLRRVPFAELLIAPSPVVAVSSSVVGLSLVWSVRAEKFSCEEPFSAFQRASCELASSEMVGFQRYCC